jgi:CBS domain containing-hemolysin-like protein
MADNNDGLQLKDIKREILVIPDTMSVFNVWELFSEKKEHIALIVDEYGTMDGIVTMEDIIETLLGIEIVDEKDTITDMQQYARERWNLKQKKYHPE